MSCLSIRRFLIEYRELDESGFSKIVVMSRDKKLQGASYQFIDGNLGILLHRAQIFNNLIFYGNG